MSEQKREYFRITYSIGDYAVLRIEKKSYAVIDISVGGLAYIVKKDAKPPRKGEKIQCTIEFQDKKQVSVLAQVVRVQDEIGHVSLKFSKQLELGLLMEQHRLWIRRNPGAKKVS